MENITSLYRPAVPLGEEQSKVEITYSATGKELDFNESFIGKLYGEGAGNCKVTVIHPNADGQKLCISAEAFKAEMNVITKQMREMRDAFLDIFP